MKKLMLAFVLLLGVVVSVKAQSIYGDKVKTDVKMKYIYSFEEALKKAREVNEGTEKVGTFQHFLSRGKNQELAKSKTVDLASFHFVQSISSRYRNLGRIRAQWQYSRYNKESPFSSNAVSA